MKFNIHVTYKDSPGEPWLEDYNRPEVKTEEQARQWAERTIQNFNNTLRPGEKARKVVDVTFEDNEAKQAHEWQKVNLVTLIDNRGAFYDRLLCLNCGVTAERWGIDSIRLSKKYRRAAKYLSCDWKEKA
jgi:hypothetical protein